MPTDNMSCFQSREPAPVIGKWDKTTEISLKYIPHLHLVGEADKKCTTLSLASDKNRLIKWKPFGISAQSIVCSSWEIWVLSPVIYIAGALILGAMRNDL